LLGYKFLLSPGDTGDKGEASGAGVLTPGFDTSD